MGDGRLRLGHHVRLVPVDGLHVLVDARSMQRITVDAAWVPLCERAAENWCSPDELAEAASTDIRSAAPAFIDLLRQGGFLTDREDENAPPVTLVDPADRPPGASANYWQPTPITAADLPTDRPLRPVKAMLIGGCVTQFAADPLVREGARRGLAITTVHEWPSIRGRLGDLIARHQPDLSVLQATVQPFLTGLWDDGVFVTATERRRRLAVTKRALASAISEYADALGNRFGMVHNVAPLAVSPFGRFDFRQEGSHREVVAELNQHIDEQVRRHPVLAVLDEERLAARFGAANLFDDLVFPFGHHGGSLDPSVAVPHQLPALGEALAAEYVAGYLVHHGLDRVKCVVVDLDDTLWPGIAADDGFSWVHGDSTGRWVHCGLHQALRILKHRGVLLATCSKGTESATIEAWRRAPAGHLLDPDDFVLHRINWQPKSANLAEICQRLGVAPEATVFLDDNPVERAEVRRHLPGVRVPELPVARFREYLLTEPGLESAAETSEARQRTETTRAMLRRAELIAASGDDFLRDLDVTAKVWHARAADLPRAAELFNRTNQFTTTAWRTTEAELAGLIADGQELYLMSVADRFAEYGIVGAGLIVDDTIQALVVSCRVIGLDVAPGFLTTCVRLRTRDRAVIGRVVPTDRNHAARDVFVRAGFTRLTEETFTLAPGSEVLDPARLPQQFTVHEEASR